MTERLYYDSPERMEWETRITQVWEREDGLYLELEQSAFYPHGGGQPCDTGRIQGIPVLEVVSEGETVLHKVAERPEASGMVKCAIDERRRFDHMQQHSGQHLLSAVCLSLLGAMTVSFHMGTDESTIDIERPGITPEEWEQVEREANRQIYLNRRIRSYFVTPEELERLPLVKPPKVTEDVRIVEIEGVEYNACGGTHVASTGGIGMIKLMKQEKMKGNVRITFLCGERALREFNASLRILGALAARFNTGREEILDRIEKGDQEQRALQAELAQLKEQNEEYLVRELLRSWSGGVLVKVFDDKPLKDLQSLAVKLAEAGKRPVLAASRADGKVVFAAPGEGGGGLPACGAFFKSHLAAYGGKGGGSDKLAQAGFGSWEQAEAFLAFAQQELAL
ncbi:alanyl-tRNA editing protein [Gorillibacterium sp. sgz5001074]|uniref:alanyl-tRNA editing protein n=1 Tax=Gorillibacterium sp. sgz5001074 TaxID=3446695 RepID=UPI003F67008C